MTMPLASPLGLPLPVASPLWWLTRLHAQILNRRVEVDFYDAYYRGDFPLPWLPAQAAGEFKRILQMTRSNYMGLVVDSKAERIQVEGFRVGGGESADDDLWRIWQANDLDSDSDQAFLEALIGGCSYLLVAPNPTDATTPLITVEHASQAIVEYEPGSGRRTPAAGLKVWTDDWTGRTLATLYLPDRLYKFQGSAALAVPGNPWELRRGFSLDGEPNPLRVVPLFELPNNPRLLTGGVSELADLTDIQDRINKTIADRLITQDFGAFPQKWATGYPSEDADGNPTPPMDIGRDRMVTTEVAETSFGQFEAAALDPYSSAKREDVKDIASRSRTPAQYLLGEMSNVNGETLKASESGLIAAVKQRRRHFGEGLERAMRAAQTVAGLPVTADLETIWSNPEFRTEGELTDAVLKRRAGSLISVRQAREDLGYTATQISRMEAEDATADGMTRLTEILNGPPA